MSSLFDTANLTKERQLIAPSANKLVENGTQPTNKTLTESRKMIMESLNRGHVRKTSHHPVPN
jgi:hypothetical protein